MVECPEYEDRDIPDDCYGCVYHKGDDCISGKVKVAYIYCPYEQNWGKAIPGACWDCEYHDGYSCFHPKK